MNQSILHSPIKQNSSFNNQSSINPQNLNNQQIINRLTERTLDVKTSVVNSMMKFDLKMS